MTDTEKPSDPLGIRPYGEALKVEAETVKIGVETVVKYIDHICEPAAKEIGLMLGDQFGHWRRSRAIALNEKLKRKLEERKEKLEDLHAPPRIVMKVFEEGSLVEDSDLQEMWAGLLASSCTEDGTGEANLIFVNILGQLSGAQARMIRLPFIEGDYSAYQHDGTEYTDVEKERSKLISYADLPNWGILKRELDHLGSLGLVSHSVKVSPQHAMVRLHYDEAALVLYARCQGFAGGLQEFLASVANGSA